MIAKLGDTVAVVWEDAWCDQTETRPEDWREAFLVTTYGVLMRRGHIVSVASEVMPGGVFRAVTHIPAGIVKRVRKIA